MSAVTLRSDALHDASANTSPIIKRAKIDLSASGDLVAAVTGKKIRVLSLSLRLATAQTLKFQSGGSTDLTGVMTTAPATGAALDWPFNVGGWIETVAGEKLNLVEGSSVQASGCLSYIEV